MNPMFTRQIVAIVLLLVFVGLWIGLKQMAPPTIPNPASINKATPKPPSNPSPPTSPPPVKEAALTNAKEFEFPIRNPFDLPPLLRDEIRRREEAARQRQLKAIAGLSTGPSTPLPELTLQGIFWGASSPRAIINRRIVDVGDTISGAQVVSIAQEGVQVSFNNQLFLLTLPIRSGKEGRPQ